MKVNKGGKLANEGRGRIIRFFKDSSSYMSIVLIVLNLGISIFLFTVMGAYGVSSFSGIYYLPLFMFISYVLIFFILASKIILKTRDEYKKGSFVDAGKKLLNSLFLITILLINLYIWVRLGDPYEHLVYYYFLPLLFLFCMVVFGVILIVVGLLKEKDKTSSVKIRYILLLILIILIGLFLIDSIFPATNFFPYFLKDVVVKTQNEDLCSKIPVGSIFYQ